MKTKTLGLVGLLCATGVGCTAHKEMRTYVKQVMHSSEDEVAAIPTSTELDAVALALLGTTRSSHPLEDLDPFCFTNYYYFLRRMNLGSTYSPEEVWYIPRLYVKDDKHELAVLPLSDSKCNTGVPAYYIPAYFLEQPSFIIYDEWFARGERS